MGRLLSTIRRINLQITENSKAHRGLTSKAVPKVDNAEV